MTNDIDDYRIRTARRRRAHTGSRLMAAVFAIIDQDGMEAVTINRIGRDARTSRGSFYNYAPTLDSMLIRIASVIGEIMEVELAERFGAVTDPIFRLSGCQRFAVARIGADPACVAILMRTLPLAGELSRRTRERLLADIGEADQAGGFDVPSVALAADLSMGAVIAMLRQTLSHGPDPAVIAAGSAMVFRALGVSRAIALLLREEPIPPPPSTSLREQAIAIGLA